MENPKFDGWVSDDEIRAMDEAEFFRYLKRYMSFYSDVIDVKKSFENEERIRRHCWFLEEEVERRKELSQ